MDLKTRITEDMKQAMRDQNKAKLQAIRLITAAIKQKEVDERITVTDTDVLAILDKMVKQRKESIRQYEAANRQDLVAQESFEIGVIQAYLPVQLTDAEIDALITNACEEVNASGPQDMGKVMGILKPKLQGRADMTIVSGKIKAKLS